MTTVLPMGESNEPDATLGRPQANARGGRGIRGSRPHGPAPAVGATIADRLGQARTARFVGRRDELSLFEHALRTPEPPFAVMYVHGPAGVGKSALLHAFDDRARAAGARPVLVDGRHIQPTPTHFRTACASLELPRPVTGPRPRPVLLVDAFERLQPLDLWLRRTLVPSLPAHTLVVIAGRQPPDQGWRADPAWTALMRVVPLANLPAADARKIVAAADVRAELRDRLVTATDGHPLALSLLAEVLAHHPSATCPAPFDDPAPTRPLLTQLVEDLPTHDHRTALTTCALARATTHAHLRAALGHDDVDIVFGWLRELPFIREGTHGLSPHPFARDVIQADSRRRDPRRHRALVTSLLRLTGEELRDGPEGNPSRSVVLDLLYLLQSDADVDWCWSFAPRSEPRPRPADPGDHEAVLRLIRDRDGPGAAELALPWLAHQPEGFRVEHDESGRVRRVVGWVSLTDADPDLRAADPMTRALWNHVQHHCPPGQDERVTALRFAGPGGAWRPPLVGLSAYECVRRAIADPALTWDLLVVPHRDRRRPLPEDLGYRRVDGLDLDIGDRRYTVFAHDWRTLPTPWTRFLDDQTWARRRVRPVVLARGDFDVAVRQALCDLHRPDALAASPLARTQLVPGGDPGRLAALLDEAARTLTGHPRDEKLYRVLDRTYLRPAPTQEKAAELLGLPRSTYRRHLSAGLTRVADWLWARAQPSRPAMDESILVAGLSMCPGRGSNPHGLAAGEV